MLSSRIPSVSHCSMSKGGEYFIISFLEILNNKIFFSGESPWTLIPLKVHFFHPSRRNYTLCLQDDRACQASLNGLKW